MRFVNLDDRDYHMHSSTFSDGLATIEEIVKLVGNMGMKEVAITDHSQAKLDVFEEKKHIFFSGPRFNLARWKNIHNDTNIIFGVEGDLINTDGDTCFDIQGIEPEFIILSTHKGAYKGAPENITEATINAIKKHHNKIQFIGHPCNNKDFGEYIDIKKLVEYANKYDVALEFNASNYVLGKTNMKKLDYLLRNANRIYLNSDGHTLYEIKEHRKMAIEFLKVNNYI